MEEQLETYQVIDCTDKFNGTNSVCITVPLVDYLSLKENVEHYLIEKSVYEARIKVLEELFNKILKVNVSNTEEQGL